MDARSADIERLRDALFQAQHALAALSGVVDPNDKDDLPASNTVTNAGPPVAPADPPAAPEPAVPESSVIPEPPIATVKPPAAPEPPAAEPPAAPTNTDESDLVPRTGIVNMLSLPQPKIDPRIGANIRKRTQQLMLEDRAEQMARWEATKSVLAELSLQSNPFVSRGRQQMNVSHCSTLAEMQPDLTEEQYYHTNVILKFAGETLLFRIQTTRGRDGGPIQSRTAVQWLGYHVFNICTYTRDPDTGDLSGLTLLRRGLFLRLENLLKWSVFEFGLGRHIRHQNVLDRPALQLIIERVLTKSESRGRGVALQTLTAISFAMFGAFRAGSLQANCAEYREKELYMQVGHLTLLVQRWCRYAVRVDVLNWKGFSGAVGHRKTLTFEPVTKAQNLIFEPGCHLALLLLARDLFQDIRDIDQLIACDKAEIKLKEDARKLPLFLKISTGGAKLIKGVPCGPHKLSQVVHHQAVSLGFPGGGIHAIRYGSAQHYAASLGQDRTIALLNHADRPGVTMGTHYVPETHVPLVAIRMNELEGNLGPVEKTIMQNQEQGTIAIHTIARRLQSTHAMGEEIMKQGRCRITKEEEEAVQKDPKIEAIVSECQAAWKKFTGLFPNASEPFTPHFVSAIKRVQSGPTNASPVLVEVRVQELEDLGLKLQKGRRQAFKRVRHANHKAATSTVISVEARKQAEQMVNQPSEVIAEAKDKMKAVISEYLKARRGDSSEQDDDSDDEDEDVQTVKESLPGRGLPPPATTMSDTAPRISQLNISLQSAPKVDIPDIGEPEEPGKFDDSAEPDVLQVPVDVMRAIYMRYIWEAYIRQNNPVVPDAEGKFVCVECPKFNSRRDDPDSFTFAKRDKFNRHMREQHDSYASLELEMQTDDPNRFKCPGCDQADFTSTKSCFKHCREECARSVDFKRLYEAHQRKRKTETDDDLARRDRDKERQYIGEQVEFPDNSLETVISLQEDLERPGFLREWADSRGVELTEASCCVDLERGHDLANLEKIARQSVEIALGGAYHSGPDDERPLEHPRSPTLGPLVASGPSTMTAIRDRAVELASSLPDHMSDYDSESD